MAHQPQPSIDALPDEQSPLAVVEPRPQLSRWAQPRDSADGYVDIERRDLRALTSLRAFAALYVVLHHLMNVGLLATRGAGADREGSLLLAWSSQGSVGVTFFFVLSGFILAWCYHRSFAAAPADAAADPALRRRFWRARFARVWPLHALMFVAFIPVVALDVGRDPAVIVSNIGQGIMNLLLVHAWIPIGGHDGLADTFNAPSWTLSVEACFYLLFPLMAIALVRVLRWGIAQLMLLAVGAWAALGVVGLAVSGDGRGADDWWMRVFPGVRLADFIVGVALGLIVVQMRQRASLRGEQRGTATSRRWTAVEAAVLLGTALLPLAWVYGVDELLPATLGTSWFYLPAFAAVIWLMAQERGAISSRVLAWRPLVWLGEVSYALYLVHMFFLLAAYRTGIYDRLGLVATSVLLTAGSIAVAGVLHARFEQPMRARLTGRR